MKITKGVEMLEISSNIMGIPSVINPTLIWNEDVVILVDAGYPGQLPSIREAVEKAGVSFEKLNMVILTHHDIDHIGGVSSILKELLKDVKVIAHEEEAAYIQGDKCPIKVAQLEANFNVLPKEMKEIYEKLKAGYENCKVKIDKTLVHCEELPFCGGITVIHTPGHTVGHICLYLKQNKTLIAGDALSIEDGILVKTPATVNFDEDLSIKSLKELTKYDIEKVICYHGGVYKDMVNDRIKELANEQN